MKYRCCFISTSVINGNYFIMRIIKLQKFCHCLNNLSFLIMAWNQNREKGILFHSRWKFHFPFDTVVEYQSTNHPDKAHKQRVKIYKIVNELKNAYHIPVLFHKRIILC